MWFGWFLFCFQTYKAIAASCPFSATPRNSQTSSDAHLQQHKYEKGKVEERDLQVISVMYKNVRILDNVLARSL